MKYNKIFIFGFLILILFGCVEQEKYDKVVSENKNLQDNNNEISSTNTILQDTILVLKKQLVDIQFGAENLLSKAKNAIKINDLYNAKNILSELIIRHELSNQALEGNIILQTVNSKIFTIEEKLLWDTTLVINEIQQYEKFIAQYPDSKYLNTAKQKIRKRKKNMEVEEWKRANDIGTSIAFTNFLTTYPSSKWKKQANKKKIDAEVNEIMAGKYGELPSSTPVSLYGGSTARVSIENNTNYTLTVRYSGNDSKSLILQAHSNGSISLKKGYYRVAASVNASNVTNYAGTETLAGGTYNSSFYISNSGYSY